METTTKSCSSCKKQKIIDLFFNKNDKPTKTCLICREANIKNSKIKLCEHKKQKAFCLICGGSAYCEHKIQKAACKDCGGSSICEHECLKSHCKQCNDPVEITIQHMVMASKQHDKKKLRYDEINFITKQFVSNLIKESHNNCCYCFKELNFDKRNSALATIERVNNSIGHIKSNVKIACLTCNLSKVGDRIIIAEN